MNKLTVKALNRLNLLKFIAADSCISVNNKKVKIPIRSSLGYEHMHVFEPWMLSLLKRLKPVFTGAFVDIGVNIGQTLIKVQSVFENPQYVGFEPNPFCVAYVNEMIKLNKWQDCNIIPTGISKSTEILKLRFFYSENIDSSASIIENFRDDQSVDHFMYIPVVREESVKMLLPDVKNCLLKVDVEGAELEVIAGLQNWIQNQRPLVIAEVLPVYAKENTFRLERQLELESCLKKMNYKIARIDKQNIALHEINEIGIHGDVEKSDYVFYPSEFREKISPLFS